VVALALAAGCGDNQAKLEVDLLAGAQWNENPTSIGEIGYQVVVDVGWPSRPYSCFPLSPDLRIRVNDLEAVPMKTGDCELDVLVRMGAFLADTPITVRLEDGERLVGEARYEGLFPGFGAQLAGTQAAEVHAGDPIRIALPAPAPDAIIAIPFLYWMNTAPSVPPFHTYVPGSFEADGQTIDLTAPPLTGRAQLVIQSALPGGFGAAQSCTGFSTCAALPAYETVGPIAVDIVP
jgi:hypothetical protein